MTFLVMYSATEQETELMTLASDSKAGRSSSNLVDTYLQVHPFSIFPENQYQFMANHKNVSLFELSCSACWKCNSGGLFWLTVFVLEIRWKKLIPILSRRKLRDKIAKFGLDTPVPNNKKYTLVLSKQLSGDEVNTRAISDKNGYCLLMSTSWSRPPCVGTMFTKQSGSVTARARLGRSGLSST